MTLKRHLTVVLTLVMALTLAAFAWLLVRTTRSELIRQLGGAVIGAAARDSPLGANPGRGGRGSNRAPGGDTDTGVAGGRRVSRLLYSSTGELLDYQASGFPDEPDPRVKLPVIGSAEQRRMVDHLVIRTSEDGSIRYLVMTRAVPSGRVRFDAISMESADAAVRRLTLIAVLGGALATFGASVATAAAMRRNLRPVEVMVATSERIASGDLTARAPHDRPGTEIGRLGGALNAMLTTIESAIAQRDEKELELRQFIADASHELRTPITVVQGYNDLYRSGALTEKAQLDKAMDRIDNQTNRMSRLVVDLLLLANLERPDFIARSRNDVAALTSESVNEFLLFSDDHPTTLRLSGPAYADVDGQRIRQVVDNLLRNVREHTEPGTEVAVEVIATAETITISVNDSGPGISPEAQKSIFQRFWRADPAKGQSSGASGLGLAITESIVTAHGGSISVRSNDAEGTTFTISLPINAPAT